MEQKEMIDEKAWLKLYNAASAFEEIRPWQWMYESDIFGVKDPLTGEIGFCCILGHLKQVFALVVYQGKEGLKSYLRLATCDETPEDSDIPLEQDCIMASFEDKANLSREDKEIIKKLELKFNGTNVWPMFRRYLPGRVPWFLNSADVEFLILALEQATIVCQRFKADKGLLRANRQNTYFVRIPQVTGQGTIWRDEQLVIPNPMEEEAPLNVFLDQDRLERIKEKTSRKTSVWEADLSYSPFSISEKTPPYYPKLFLCCEQSSGYVLGHQIFAPGKYQESLPDYFLDLIETVGLLPSIVQVNKDALYHLLYPLLSGLGVTIEKIADLPAVREARKGLSTFFKREKIGRNEPCPCGSGKKYKKCCLRNNERGE